MNDTFSLSRFGLLTRKFIKEHFRIYLLYTAGLTGIMLFVYSLATISALYGTYEEEAGEVFYSMGIILTSMVFSGNFYGFFSNKAKAIRFINLPSSTSEKIAISFLFTQVIFFVTFIVLFALVDRTMCAIYNNFHVTPKYVSAQDLRFYTAVPLDLTAPVQVGGLMLAFVGSAIAHFASLCFEKHAFIKIAMILLVCGAALIYTNYFVMKELIPEEVMPGGMFYSSKLRVGTDQVTKGVILLPESWDKFIYWFYPGMLYVLFWTASYFRLKEKQV